VGLSWSGSGSRDGDGRFEARWGWTGQGSDRGIRSERDLGDGDGAVCSGAVYVCSSE
jgi:hypothetical protein